MRVLHETDSPIVQLSAGVAQSWIVVSTMKKSYLLCSELHLRKQPIPIGQKDRKRPVFVSVSVQLVTRVHVVATAVVALMGRVCGVLTRSRCWCMWHVQDCVCGRQASMERSQLYRFLLLYVWSDVIFGVGFCHSSVS